MLAACGKGQRTWNGTCRKKKTLIGDLAAIIEGDRFDFRGLIDDAVELPMKPIFLSVNRDFGGYGSVVSDGLPSTMASLDRGGRS